MAPKAKVEMTPEAFIKRWDGANGSERANYQSFFNDLCELLGVDKPDPAHADKPPCEIPGLLRHAGCHTDRDIVER